MSGWKKRLHRRAMASRTFNESQQRKADQLARRHTEGPIVGIGLLHAKGSHTTGKEMLIVRALFKPIDFAGQPRRHDGRRAYPRLSSSGTPST